MSSHLDVVGSGAVVVVVLMVALWLLSLPLRDVSIVDIGWGLGFVAVAWTTWLVGDGNADRSNLLTAMVTIWGLRLAFHLAWRNLGHGEDRRYQSLRRARGDSFAITSLFTVFALQGAVMFIVALPVMLAMTPRSPAVGVLGLVGVIVWGVGFFFEVVGDSQLARFKADPDNADEVLDWGLWRYSRHPNYFGDACVWWGIWLVAAESVDAAYAVAGPILMTIMLLRVTGVPVLERGLHRRREGYAAYAAVTSRFVPRPRQEP